MATHSFHMPANDVLALIRTRHALPPNALGELVADGVRFTWETRVETAPSKAAAIRAELAKAGPEGLRARDIAKSLGVLPTDVNAQFQYGMANGTVQRVGVGRYRPADQQESTPKVA